VKALAAVPTRSAQRRWLLMVCQDVRSSWG
jgi:hypothetical protein